MAEQKRRPDEVGNLANASPKAKKKKTNVSNLQVEDSGAIADAEPWRDWAGVQVPAALHDVDDSSALTQLVHELYKRLHAAAPESAAQIADRISAERKEADDFLASLDGTWSGDGTVTFGKSGVIKSIDVGDVSNRRMDMWSPQNIYADSHTLKYEEEINICNTNMNCSVSVTLVKNEGGADTLEGEWSFCGTGTGMRVNRVPLNNWRKMNPHRRPPPPPHRRDECTVIIFVPTSILGH